MICTFAEEILNEENIDRIIINIGTNNLSYQNQTENEIMIEIIEIVKKCHQYGVNEIFIAGVTIRPRYEKQINIINNLLKENATRYNYQFICTADIMEKHLWKDKLHLNEQGTIILVGKTLDVFLISETKIDCTFPEAMFSYNGFSMPHRKDKF